MEKRKKYDFEFLQKYCSENNVVLLDDYSCKYVTRNINIKCKCIMKIVIMNLKKFFVN